MTPLLSVRDLRVGFGQKPSANEVVKGVSFDLAAGETQDVRTRIVSIYTHHDNIIAPQDSSVLPGARNVAFGGVGHVALGSNPRVLAEVLRVLREVQPAMA